MMNVMQPRILPLVPEGECFALALRRAARSISRRYDDAFAPLDLNNGQFSMLALIAGFGSVRIQTLADRLAMDRTTVTAALKPLQRRKLVRVDAGTDDARARDATLTREGERLLAKAIPIWQSKQDEIASRLSAADAKTMRRHLASLE